MPTEGWAQGATSGSDALEVPPASGNGRHPSPGRQRSSILGRWLASIDFLAALGAGTIAALPGLGPGQALAFGAAGAAIWTGTIFGLGLYGAPGLRSWVSGIAETPRVLGAALAASWPLVGIATALGAPHPIGLALLTLLVTVPVSALAKAAARAALHRSDLLQQRVALVGSGAVTTAIVRKVAANGQFGLAPVGFVDGDAPFGVESAVPWLGDLDELPDVLDRHAIDRVIVGFSRSDTDELLRCIRCCRERGVAVDVVPRLFESLAGVGSLESLGGIPLVSLGPPRLTRSSIIAKRLLDVVGSLLLLIALAPLLLLVALAIKLESPGPVLFTQRRTGLEGREFSMLKFRSMVAGAEALKSELESELDDEVMFKIKDDPRLTRLGRPLRRLSIDELPQLFNVLRGDMSLVGPRPLAAEAAAVTDRWHHRRLDLRPGLTGPWQVHGRSENGFAEMMRFDFEYVMGWSLARDIQLLLATVPAVLSRRGAY